MPDQSIEVSMKVKRQMVTPAYLLHWFILDIREPEGSNLRFGLVKKVIEDSGDKIYIYCIWGGSIEQVLEKYYNKTGNELPITAEFGEINPIKLIRPLNDSEKIN